MGFRRTPAEPLPLVVGPSLDSAAWGFSRLLLLTALDPLPLMGPF